MFSVSHLALLDLTAYLKTCPRLTIQSSSKSSNELKTRIDSVALRNDSLGMSYICNFWPLKNINISYISCINLSYVMEIFRYALSGWLLTSWVLSSNSWHDDCCCLSCALVSDFNSMLDLLFKSHSWLKLKPTAVQTSSYPTDTISVELNECHAYAIRHELLPWWARDC